MKLSELQNYLSQNPAHALQFVLPDGDLIPAHAHITEAGRIDKTFLDCGGTLRRTSVCSLQAWVAADVEHRISPAKLADVLTLAAPIFAGDDLEIEVEYEDCAISQYPLLSASLSEKTLCFTLGSKHTDCLARDLCLPEQGCC